MIDFSCKLVGPGWIESTHISEDNEIEIIPSYLSDAPNDLIFALALLLEGENETICKWQDEPGEYRWIFKKQNKSFELKVIKLEQTFSRHSNENAEIIFCSTENLAKFAHRVLREFNIIKINYTISGYKDLWGYEFPSKAINRLNLAISNSHFS